MVTLAFFGATFGGLLIWPLSLGFARKAKSRWLFALFVAQLLFSVTLIAANLAFGERDMFDNPGWLFVLNAFSPVIGALFLAASLVVFTACAVTSLRKGDNQDASVT